jgi:hypothetical protein
MAIVFSTMFGCIAVSEYSKSQCQIEGIRAGLTAEYINKTCGVSR